MPNETQKLKKQLYLLCEWTITTTNYFIQWPYIFKLPLTTLNLPWDVDKVRRQDLGRVLLSGGRLSLSEPAWERNTLLKNSAWEKLIWSVSSPAELAYCFHWHVWRRSSDSAVFNSSPLSESSVVQRFSSMGTAPLAPFSCPFPSLCCSQIASFTTSALPLEASLHCFLKYMKFSGLATAPLLPPTPLGTYGLKSTRFVCTESSPPSPVAWVWQVLSASSCSWTRAGRGSSTSWPRITRAYPALKSASLLPYLTQLWWNTDGVFFSFTFLSGMKRF